VGVYAGFNNQTGSDNAVLGHNAGAGGLYSSFSSSTLMGYSAGNRLTTGSDNILLGFQAGDSITTGNRNIIIGYDQDAPTSSTNNHLNIGGAIYGDLSTGQIGIGTAAPAYKLDVVGAVNATAVLVNGVPVGGGTQWANGIGGLISYSSAVAIGGALQVDATSYFASTVTVNGDLQLDEVKTMSVDQNSRMLLWDNDGVVKYELLKNVVSGGGSGPGGVSDLTFPVWNNANGKYVDSAITENNFGVNQVLTIDDAVVMNHTLEAKGDATLDFRLLVKGDGLSDTTPVFQIISGTTTVLANGNVGIGVENPGAKLEVAGQIKITGGNPGYNKVLTSDEIGLAEWKDQSTLVQGDNLGNHTAVMDLEMSGYAINNAGAITSSGTITALNFIGNGSGLTGITGDNLGNHTASTSLNMSNYPINNVSTISASGSITAARYYGDGSALTNLTSTPVGSALTSANIWVGNAANQAAAVVMSGDATLANTGVLTLKNMGTAGTYRSVTTDTQGRVTAGTNPTTFAGYGISDTSANLAAALTDETGTGNVVFSSGPIFTGNVGISTGAPAARLDVLAGGLTTNDMAQIWRNSNGVIMSSMSATGVMKAAKFVGDGSGLTNIAGSGDNLGNHTATTSLNMANFPINNVSTISASGSITAARYYGDGSSLSGVAGDNLGNHTATTALNMAGNQIMQVSSITIVGNAFSIGGSTLVVKAGSIGIGMPAPAYILDVNGQARIGSGTMPSSRDLMVGGAGTVYLNANGNGDHGFALYNGVSGTPQEWWNFQRSSSDGRYSIGYRAASSGTLTDYLNITTAGNVGIGTMSPAAKLAVSGDMIVSNNAYIVGYSSATKYYGDGSGLTNISAVGDNLGNHMAAATLNMAGYQVINVSTIVFTGSDGGIVLSPYVDTSKNYAYSQGIAIGSAAYGNYGGGVGVGNNANNNYNYGLGIGNSAFNNYDNGTGVGNFAHDNENYGVGVGNGASFNYNNAVGVGPYAGYNYNYGSGFGPGASNNFEYGVAVGYSASNNNNNGVGVGAGAYGNSTYGVGVGASAFHNSNYAVGIGAYSHDNQPLGAALGAYSYAASSSTALGSYAKANAPQSMAIGNGTINNLSGTASFGAYAINTSSDLLVSGNVGVGTTTPAYKLDVAGAVNATSVLVNGVPVGGGTQWANGTGGLISYSSAVVVGGALQVNATSYFASTVTVNGNLQLGEVQNMAVDQNSRMLIRDNDGVVKYELLKNILQGGPAVSGISNLTVPVWNDTMGRYADSALTQDAFSNPSWLMLNAGLHVSGNAIITSSMAVSGVGLSGAAPVFQVAGSTMTVLANGNVGVGTASPTAKLEVSGGAIKASGGFIIEIRTSDPVALETGQMWLRTDLP